MICSNKTDKRKRDIYPSKLIITEFEKHYDDLRNKLNELRLFTPTPMSP